MSAPIDIVWECMLNTDNWYRANWQIKDIRRNSSETLNRNETFEIDTQYESEGPISTSVVTILDVKPKKKLIFSNNENEQQYEFLDKGDEVLVTVTSISKPSFPRLIFRLFGMNEAKLIKKSFLTGMARLAREKHRIG